MTWFLVVLTFVIVLAIFFIATASISRARRIDRLHQRILASRDALSTLLLRRATEALLLAADVRGLEAEEENKRQIVLEAANAYVQDTAEQLSADGLDRRSDSPLTASEKEVGRHLERASALSRAIRHWLNEPMRERLEGSEAMRERLAGFDATCYRVQMVRSVHNADVASVRTVRSTPGVKLLHLAGHAPLARPIDFDDDTRTGGRGY